MVLVFCGMLAQVDNVIQTDASGTWGCGAFFEGKRLQVPWPPVWLPCNMTKDLVPIILSCCVWGPCLARQRILFQLRM